MDSKAAAADANTDINCGAIKLYDYVCLQRQCAATQKSICLLQAAHSRRTAVGLHRATIWSGLSLHKKLVLG